MASRSEKTPQNTKDREFENLLRSATKKRGKLQFETSRPKKKVSN
jgi:hypothetical protein